MSTFPPPQLQYKVSLIKIQQHRLTRLSLWRACFMISCVTGLGLLATVPNSQIKKSSQIEINGEQLVSENTIRRALKFSYPQFIWSINGIDLTRKIESIPSVKAVKVSKQIIPPRITISLQEKTPVALSTSSGQVGFLSEQGEWIEQKFYDNTNLDIPLPKLKVINYQPRLKSVWSEIYQLNLLYPELKITEVHWREGDRIFLKTRIGQVLLGSEASRLEQQFKIISKLENLSQRVDAEEIAYIDLSNPGVNLIQKY